METRCSRSPNPDAWFTPETFDIVQKICAGCPVKVGCRIAGMNEPYGVWGGTTPADRGFQHRDSSANFPTRRAYRRCDWTVTGPELDAELAAGASLKAAARNVGIGYSTARAYLRRTRSAFVFANPALRAG